MDKPIKKISIILGAVILIVILANISNILAHAKLYSFENNKNVETETKVVTFNEIFDILTEQRELEEELKTSTKYSLIGDEVRKGIDEASDYERYLAENKQIKSIKIKIPITTYKDHDKTIEFISGKGEMLEIFKINK
ncbi:hypothetical protein [Pseudalkalibacillus sp. NRS-1564]|uniref:hypothetical protein n=1 Tax=Pseudalkalibacillus sp. NRS-1564 TaxID=3233900 RepID=UPI003D2803B5